VWIPFRDGAEFLIPVARAFAHAKISETLSTEINLFPRTFPRRRKLTPVINTACELGFRGSLDEWERLMGAVAKR
jgi:hypothetical protein